MLLASALPALLLLPAGPAPAPPDLAKVDRTLVGEPAYRTGSPKYCLVLFGPEAKTRVWLVLDGDRLFVQRDGKGAWVARQGHHFLLGDVVEAGGKARHKALTFFRNGEGSQLLSVRLDGKFEQMAGWDRHGRLRFAARPQDAPVIHFNGPLKMDLFRNQRPLSGQRKEGLCVVVGTPGVGPGTFARLDCDAFLPGGAPVAEVLYPGKGEPGRQVVQRVSLCHDH
jgi:hypothetical protein